MRRFVLATCMNIAILFALANVAAAGTVTLTFNSVNGASQGGVYVSPYYGTVNGVPTGFVCDDFIHEVTFGETWDAFVSTFDGLDHVRFHGTNAADTLKMYDEAAFLLEKMWTEPAHWGDLNFAIWAIFSPTQAEGSSGWTAGAQADLALAQSQAYAPGQFAGLRIYTPLTTGNPQEFIGFNPTPTPAPEPGTMLLLGSGLLVGLVRRRRSQ